MWPCTTSISLRSWKTSTTAGWAPGSCKILNSAAQILNFSELVWLPSFGVEIKVSFVIPRINLFVCLRIGYGIHLRFHGFHSMPNINPFWYHVIYVDLSEMISSISFYFISTKWNEMKWNEMMGVKRAHILNFWRRVMVLQGW
jgi:hypothetical protein